jgi:hypothetical protein
MSAKVSPKPDGTKHKATGQPKDAKCKGNRSLGQPVHDTLQQTERDEQKRHHYEDHVCWRPPGVRVLRLQIVIDIALVPNFHLGIQLSD